MFRRAKKAWILFAALPLLYQLGLLLAPAVDGLVLSFDRNGPSLANYRAILNDPLFWRALANNLIVPAGSLVLEFVTGLGLAMLLTSCSGALGAMLDVSAMLPFVIPEIVLLSIIRYLFMPRGYVNGALLLAGLGPLPWLVPCHILDLVTVMIADAWHVTPVVMLILVAGLQTIPQELYEAARLDGAGALTTFRHITLPMLAPAIAGALMLRGVDALRIFSTTLVLTGVEGVPVISTYAYQQWTDAQEPALAMAASGLLALMVVMVALAGLVWMRHNGKVQAQA